MKLFDVGEPILRFELFGRPVENGVIVHVPPRDQRAVIGDLVHTPDLEKGVYAVDLPVLHHLFQNKLLWLCDAHFFWQQHYQIFRRADAGDHVRLMHGIDPIPADGLLEFKAPGDGWTLPAKAISALDQLEHNLTWGVARGWFGIKKPKDVPAWLVALLIYEAVPILRVEVDPLIAWPFRERGDVVEIPLFLGHLMGAVDPRGDLGYRALLEQARDLADIQVSSIEAVRKALRNKDELDNLLALWNEYRKGRKHPLGLLKMECFTDPGVGEKEAPEAEEIVVPPWINEQRGAVADAAAQLLGRWAQEDRIEEDWQEIR